MDIRKIRTFVYVSELKSFTRASVFLHISQPALSRQIKLLEEEVGVKLFVRSGHGVELTEQGKIFLDRSVGFLSQFASLRTDFKIPAQSGEQAGKVTLGLPVPATRFISSDFLERLKQKHPGISLEIAEGFNPLIHEWLLSGSIDLAILYGNFPTAMMKKELLAVENLFAIGPATEVNKARSEIPLSELRQNPLILPNRPHILRTIADQIGIRDSAITEANAITLMFELARAGRGYSILPGNSLSPAIASGDVVALKIVDPGLSWDVSIWHSSLQELSDPAQIVRKLLHEQVIRLVNEGGWSAKLADGVKD
jgi:LysR family nitrogen assimilation transcriptional regulator